MRSIINVIKDLRNTVTLIESRASGNIDEIERLKHDISLLESWAGLNSDIDNNCNIESITSKFFDINGVEIKSGMVIKNNFDRNPYQKVSEIEGVLWFGAVGTSINDDENDWCKMTSRYGFEKFWEVIS